MKIDLSIFLMAVGAILTFAVPDVVKGFDLALAGYALMSAGLVGLCYHRAF